MSLPIGLQLYSIKDEIAKDFKGALMKVADIGYEGVEFAGYGGLKSSELRSLLDELGLKACGSHIGIDELEKNIDTVIEYNLEINNPYIICPWTDPHSIQDYRDITTKLNRIGEKCEANGLICCYHNHNHEFQKFGGEYGLDILYRMTNPEFVKAEIDTYWVGHAGLDPVEYIKKYSGRCELVHIKDMEIMDGEKRSTEIGNGIMDIESIINEAEKCGTKWLIVEQEYFNGSPIESIKVGYKNLKKLVEGEI